jgi:AcrR family transcriptional regulator
VEEIQRARLLAAMVDVTVERGLADATVARIVACAGVSRRTFYELFDDREECFLAALDYAIAWASDQVVPAYRAGKDWRERIRLALAALLSLFDTEPGVGQLLIVWSLGAGPVALERRQRVLTEIASIVDAGGREEEAAIVPPPLTAEGVVGAVFSVIHARMLSGERHPLIELLNPLMNMVVMPYLGPAAARRELERPAVTAHAGQAKLSGDPLKGLGMRLTYRTVRVLLAIGAHPGASNKEIGEASGAQDQGQISKLLARLERLGLIGNGGVGSTKGAPNAWMLTDRGREVQGALATEPSNC